MPPTREAIIEALGAAFRTEPAVRAYWEGGSAAFGAVDAMSDVDLQIVVADGAVAHAVEVAERALGALAPIEWRWEIPQPSWHGHWQCFYRLEGTGPHLLIDLVVMERSNRRRFVEREIHGEPRIFFDHDHLLTPPPIDRDAIAAAHAAAIAKYRDRRPLIGTLVQKELARGRVLDAFQSRRRSEAEPESVIKVTRRSCSTRSCTWSGSVTARSATTSGGATSIAICPRRTWRASARSP